MKIVVGVLVLFSSLRMLVHGYLIPQTLVVVPLLVLAVSLVASWMLHSTPPSLQENRGAERYKDPGARDLIEQQQEEHSGSPGPSASSRSRRRGARAGRAQS